MNFVRYKNLSGKSNVEAFSIGFGCIVVKFFNTPKLYKYSYNSAGKKNIDKMIELAKSGFGLNRYIKTQCNNLYER